MNQPVKGDPVEISVSWLDGGKISQSTRRIYLSSASLRSGLNRRIGSTPGR